MANATIKVDFDLNVPASAIEVVKKQVSKISKDIQENAYHYGTNSVKQTAQLAKLKQAEKARQQLTMGEARTQSVLLSEEIKISEKKRKAQLSAAQDAIKTKKIEESAQFQADQHDKKNAAEDLKHENAQKRQNNADEKSAAHISSIKKKTEDNSKKISAKIIVDEQKASKLKTEEELKRFKLDQQRKKEEEKEESKKRSGGFFNGVGSSINRGLTSYGEDKRGTSVGLGNIASFAGTLGTAGAIAAAVALAIKAVKSFAGQAELNYSSRSLGSGFTPSAFNALNRNKVGNEAISENMSDAIVANRKLFDPNNRFRTIGLNDIAISAASEWGTRAFSPLVDLDPRKDQKQIWKILQEGIKSASAGAALDVGHKVGLNDETILGLRTGKVSYESLEEAAKGFRDADKPGALDHSFNVVSAIDKGTGVLGEILATLATIASGGGHLAPYQSIQQKNNQAIGMLLPTNTPFGNTP